MTTLLIFVAIYVLLTFAGPLYIYITGKVILFGDYKTASRESALLAPHPEKFKESIIQMYAARTFNWRGLFSVHTWIAVKPAGHQKYTVHQKIGWRLFHNLPPVFTQEDVPDRHWFNQKPIIFLDLRGKDAEALIPKIAHAVTTYPFLKQYKYWPGPNSNTFIAHIGREVPELKLVMPSLAIGKDFLIKGFFAKAISNTGFQISFKGLLGFTIAWLEGIEVNILGLIYGINPLKLTLKLPGFGDITLIKK